MKMIFKVQITMDQYSIFLACLKRRVEAVIESYYSNIGGKIMFSVIVGKSDWTSKHFYVIDGTFSLRDGAVLSRAKIKCIGETSFKKLQ